MQENPAIADWVPSSGGSTEGLLGGRLAQRQAALREGMAAGALSTFTLGLPCVPMISRAPAVPEKRFLWKLGVIRLRVAPDVLVPSFDDETKIVNSHDLNRMLPGDDKTVARSCRPEFAAHDHCASR